MAIVTAINLTVGGTSDEVVVDNQASVAQPPADITWSGLPTGVTVTPDPDGQGFDFLAGSTAAPGSTPVTATYNGPGNPSPVSATLTVNVMAAAPTVTGLLFNEIQGS